MSNVKESALFRRSSFGQSWKLQSHWWLAQFMKLIVFNRSDEIALCKRDQWFRIISSKLNSLWMYNIMRCNKFYWRLVFIDAFKFDMVNFFAPVLCREESDTFTFPNAVKWRIHGGGKPQICQNSESIFLRSLFIILCMLLADILKRTGSATY